MKFMSGLDKIICKGHSDYLQNLKVSRLEFVNTCNWWEKTSNKLGEWFKDNDCLTYGKGSKLCELIRKHWAWNIRTYVVGNYIMRRWEGLQKNENHSLIEGVFD